MSERVVLLVDNGSRRAAATLSLRSIAGRFAEARAVYRELVQEFPGSVYTAPSRARADYLETAEQS